MAVDSITESVIKQVGLTTNPPLRACHHQHPSYSRLSYSVGSDDSDIQRLGSCAKKRAYLRCLRMWKMDMSSLSETLQINCLSWLAVPKINSFPHFWCRVFKCKTWLEIQDYFLLLSKIIQNSPRHIAQSWIFVSFYRIHVLCFGCSFEFKAITCSDGRSPSVIQNDPGIKILHHSKMG